MVFLAWKLEDSMYSHYVIDGRGFVDCLSSWGGSDTVYEGILADQCYRCRYVYYSTALSESAFCLDCRDCSDCFMSTGLRHKQYYFKNQQYTKEEYQKILKEYRLDTFGGVERAKKEFAGMLYAKPRKFASLRNCVDSTGDYLANCKNIRNGFVLQRVENCRWVESSDAPKDSYDLSTGGELEQCYEGITPDHSYQSRFAIFAWGNRDVSYVDGVHSSTDVFGCCGLKNSQYCILNKQYSKEEYGEMLQKVREHMDQMPYVDKNSVAYRFGEFFPAELSYFGYNESAAQDHFPLAEEDARKRNFCWREKLQMTIGKETMRSTELPDAIADVTDSITNEILACTECGRNYRIVVQELEFYRKMKIPLPRKCFYCRHRARVNFRNPFRLWHRTCMCPGTKSQAPSTSAKGGSATGGKSQYENTATHPHGESPCPTEFETSYAPDRPEIVYCESCYNSEVA